MSKSEDNTAKPSISNEELLASAAHNLAMSGFEHDADSRLAAINSSMAASLLVLARNSMPVNVEVRATPKTPDPKLESN